VTRTESVRHATVITKENVRHAAAMAAPYAGTAKDTAVHYAGEARKRLAPKMSSAAAQARNVARAQYDAYLAERIADQRRHKPLPRRARVVKGALSPGVGASAAAVRTARTVKHAREAARQAAEYASPRVGHAVETARAAAEPVREEAAARGSAALAALRGQVSARDISKLLHRQERRAAYGRFAKRLMVLGTLAGGGLAVWRWWNRQTTPDWLVEAPSPTEVADGSTTGDTEADRARLSPVDRPERKEQRKGPGQRGESGDGSA
jgi:hypothetical protein